MNKRLFKKLVSLLICIAVFISLMGCSSNQDAKQSQIELIDQAGRTVTLEQPAQKIVSCYYITTYATCLWVSVIDLSELKRKQILDQFIKWLMGNYWI